MDVTKLNTTKIHFSLHFNLFEAHKREVNAAMNIKTLTVLVVYPQMICV